MIAYKLFRKRKDGSLGSLFINRAVKLKPGAAWLKANVHPTKGFKVRPGWHCTAEPKASHLSPVGRVWCLVEILDYTELKRPQAQGGLWYIADKLKIVKEL